MKTHLNQETFLGMPHMKRINFLALCILQQQQQTECMNVKRKSKSLFWNHSKESMARPATKTIYLSQEFAPS